MTGGVGSFGFGTGPDIDVAFEVVAAVSLSEILVRVDFSAALDPFHPQNFNAFNYVIGGLTVVAAAPYGSHSVILQTSIQTPGDYLVEVNTTPERIQAIEGDYLDEAHATASFEGVPVKATFRAAAQSSRKVRLEFSESMTIDSVVTDPLNYQLRRVDGVPTTISAVEQTGPDTTRLQLTLAQDLTPMGYYNVQIGALVKSEAGHAVSPDRASFRWKRVIPRPIRVAFDSFSGEVTGGLLGSPAGQVFLSPAYGASAANSKIQVDRVSVCTRAYDVYRPPVVPDPQPLFTFPGRPGSSSLIGALGGVLLASAYRLGQAEMHLADLREDALSAPVDGPAEGLLSETIDITRASFLNDDRWRIFPATGASLGAFRTADNQTLIGPGPTVGPFAIP